MNAAPAPDTFRALIHKIFRIVPTTSMEGARLLEQARLASKLQENAAKELMLQLERLQTSLVPDHPEKT